MYRPMVFRFLIAVICRTIYPVSIIVPSSYRVGRKLSRCYNWDYFIPRRSHVSWSSMVSAYNLCTMNISASVSFFIRWYISRLNFSITLSALSVDWGVGAVSFDRVPSAATAAFYVADVNTRLQSVQTTWRLPKCRATTFPKSMLLRLRSTI